MVYFDSDLKPCPFCGSKAERGYNISYGSYTRCSDCEVIRYAIPSKTSEQLWNDRSYEAEIEFQREQLKVCVDALKKLANSTLKTTWQEDIQVAKNALRHLGVDDV